MTIRKVSLNKILILFLFSHIFIWTLIPTISNNNLPLDTIEALAWSSNLDWGYSKHPPLSAFAVEFFYRIFGSQDWAYYLLSQIFVVSSFFIVWIFSKDFFKNQIFGLLAVLLLEGIFFYNFTTPEFNVNVCQLPFWALTVLYCWKGIKDNKTVDWLLFGLFAALGILSKYLFVYLLIAIDVFFIYLIVKKKINFKCFISLVSFFIILTPHLFWLIDNNYITFDYAIHRTGVEDSNFLKSHLTNPFIFLIKQFGILIPFFIMIFFIVLKFKTKININDKKLIFLIVINVVPIVLMFLTSLFMGAKIRTMWMTPFYLFISVLFLYLLQKGIILRKLEHFFSIFLIFFILFPMTYFYISTTQTDKRTDYPGKKVSKIIQKKWEDNYINDIALVAGNEWHGGNLSYHLKTRPKWDNILEDRKKIKLEDVEGGFVIIGDSNILNKICSGIFFELENQGICMVGKRK